MHGVGNEGPALLELFEGPVLLELFRSASKNPKNPRVLNWLSFFLLVFMGVVILKKLFDFFFRSSNS